MLDSFRDKRADRAQLGERAILRGKIDNFLRPKESRSRRASERAHQNAAARFRLACEQLGDVRVR